MLCVTSVSKDEAEALLRRRVRSVIDFSDVPKWTTGRVTEMDEIEPNGFELVIEWDLPSRDQSKKDWVTKEEFERSLIEE